MPLVAKECPHALAAYKGCQNLARLDCSYSNPFSTFCRYPMLFSTGLYYTPKRIASKRTNTERLC